jgi:nitrite reductase/ring-hydroxylating ferredoxin subunit
MQRKPVSDVDNETHGAGGPAAKDAPGGASEAGATRRGVMLGAGLVGVAGVVAACGGSSDGAAAPPGTGRGGAGAPLGKTSDIPVGGGKIFADRKVVVTQPEAGTFKAFSGTCTHRGCLVGSVSGGTINCPCHGSKFAITDASVTAGPADKPLPPQRITVEGGEIKLT